jgi:hypothetical protein
LIDSRDVALLLFAISAGEALAFLVAIYFVWKSFDGKLREQDREHHRELNEVKDRNHALQAQVDKLTNIVVANYGIRIEAGEDVVVGQDVVGRDKEARGQ